MKFCPQCGHETFSGVQYCEFCGYAFSDDEPTTDEDVGATPFAVGSQTKISPVNYEETPREVPVNMRGAIKQCFRRGGMKGRASRPEFWYWALFVFLTVVFPLSTVIWLYSSVTLEVAGVIGIAGFAVMVAAFVWGVVCIVPTLAVTVRRFHDVGLPGFPPYLVLVAWFFAAAEGSGSNEEGSAELDNEVAGWIFFGFLAFLILLVLVVAVFPGTNGPNKYGLKPERRRENPAACEHDDV